MEEKEKADVEIWKEIPIENLDEKYGVSNLGRIRNTETRKILKQNIKNGYYMIRLANSSKKYVSLSINRVVLITFKGINEDKPISNHIDGDKLNNKLDNLEWTTQKENIKHANENNLIKIPKKTILKYDLEDNFIYEFESVYEAVKDLNITRHAIHKVLKGQNQTAGGFKWKYKDEKYNKVEISNNMKKIENYPNYMVSKDGKVYSIQLGRNLQPVKNANGYHYVTLCTGVTKEKKNCYIHTIVANAFISKIKDKPFVNHIDSNKINNKLENLEWVSNSENVKHARKQKSLHSEVK
jgi:NUMOD4 motif/HNH endonuclease/DNA endonuclease I-HmuI-like, NUMOD-like domain